MLIEHIIQNTVYCVHKNEVICSQNDEHCCALSGERLCYKERGHEWGIIRLDVQRMKQEEVGEGDRTEQRERKG